MYRLLNDDYSCKMIKSILKNDLEIHNNIYDLLMDISNEDPDLFKDKINSIIGLRHG